MGPTLASPYEEYWAAVTHWKTAGMLVDSGCTDHIVTNIDAFPGFMPIQSVVRNPNGEAYRGGGQRLCEDQHNLKQKGNSNANSKIFFVCQTTFKTTITISLKMQGVGT